MKKRSFLAKMIYHLCQPLIRRGVIDRDNPANIFQHEVDKAQQFDDGFGLSAHGKVVLEIGSGVGGYVQHTLRSNAKFVYGVENNDGWYQSATSLLSERYDRNNYKMLYSDARNLPMVDCGSIDLIVSDAVLEHIQGIDKLFDEIHRILKPGGKAYLATSPIWFTYNGGHQWRYIPLPWIHLLVPDSVIIEVLETYKETGEFPTNMLDNMILLYETIGKLSLYRIRKFTKQSGFEIEALRNESGEFWKRCLITFPILEELFAGGIKIVLRKPG